MTILTDRPGRVDSGVRPGRRRSPWTGVLWGLGFAIFAIGAWLIYDTRATPAADASVEINQLLHDYRAAWNDYNAGAFLAQVTDDYVVESSVGMFTAPEQAQNITDLNRYLWWIRPVGAPTITGEGPWQVTQTEHLSGIFYTAMSADVTSTYTVVDEGGTLKVARYVVIGDLNQLNPPTAS